LERDCAASFRVGVQMLEFFSLFAAFKAKI
jgi:hypothetical protein